MFSAGGHVATHTDAPASASDLAIANPKPPSSATPATSARRPEKSMFSILRYARALRAKQVATARPFRRSVRMGQCPWMSGRIVRGKPHPAAAVPPPPPPPPALPPGGGPSFSRALWRMTSADVSEGNDVALFSDGAATFDAMIELIDNAQGVGRARELYPQVRRGRRAVRGRAHARRRGAACMHNCSPTGSAFAVSRSSYLRALRAARRARQGVQSARVPALARASSRATTENCWWWTPPPESPAASASAMSGRAESSGGGGSRGATRACSIAGPAASDFMAAFGRMWQRAGGERPPRSERKLTRASRGADLDPAASVPSVVGIVEGEPGRLRVGRALHLQAAAAQRSIWVASAYFVPSFAEVESLNGAARDGVDVRLLLPSRYDHPWVHGLARRTYAGCCETACESGNGGVR